MSYTSMGRAYIGTTRALLRLERTINLLEGGKGGEGGWGREGGEGTGWDGTGRDGTGGKG